MKILLQVALTDLQVRKIGWDLGMYPKMDLPDETECKDWLEDLLRGAFDHLPSPPSASII